MRLDGDFSGSDALRVIRGYQFAAHESSRLVLGMPHPRWGESPHAFVILRAGATATEDEVKAHVRNQLAHFKTPQ